MLLNFVKIIWNNWKWIENMLFCNHSIKFKMVTNYGNKGIDRFLFLLYCFINRRIVLHKLDWTRIDKKDLSHKDKFKNSRHFWAYICLPSEANLCIVMWYLTRYQEEEENACTKKYSQFWKILFKQISEEITNREVTDNALLV